MTKTSRKWRDKKLNKIRVCRKLHNSTLGLITGMMGVILLISICSEVNRYTIAMFAISILWLELVMYAN